MKQKQNREKGLSELSREELIAFVSSKIKGRNLFPEQVKRAKQILDRTRFIKKIEEYK